MVNIISLSVIYASIYCSFVSVFFYRIFLCYQKNKLQMSPSHKGLEIYYAIYLILLKKTGKRLFLDHLQRLGI